MSNRDEEKVYDILNKLKIQYNIYRHEPIYTIDEANQLDINIPGQHCKNLFLRNKKGDVHYLVIVDELKQLDLKSLSEKIGCSHLSFASTKRLYKYLGVTPGSVSPFGLINDTDNAVQVLIDKDLIGANEINFSPNVNTATISISYADFEKFIKWCGNKATYISINN